MNAFIKSADSRETSTELMQVIFSVAGKNEIEAERVWEDPTETELLSIWEIVTNNGRIDSHEFCWGTSGDAWARDIETNAK